MGRFRRWFVPGPGEESPALSTNSPHNGTRPSVARSRHYAGRRPVSSRGVSRRYVSGYEIGEINGAELINAPEMQPYSFVVVRHDIDTSKLGEQTGDLVRWYINDFFAGLKGGSDLPQFLVFLNVIYREVESKPAFMAILDGLETGRECARSR